MDVVLYLFVDTNLLIQCQPLEQLDWSSWSSFDEVRLIVSSPVLREIDYRKNKGNDRVGQRARAASSMFRGFSNEGYKIVHDRGPCVKLCVEPQHQQSKELGDSLNYQERDDQIVGIVYEFAKSNPETQVRLLTHDTTPLFTARGLGLVADVIPDEWLLPPETTKSEKELVAIKAENARLKKAEPSFEIRCLNSAGKEIERHESSITWFKPLTDSETNALMQQLKEHFPLETDLGSRESAERDVGRLGISTLAINQVFTPATEKEITKYREEAYPQWLERCEEVLSNLHWILQRQVPVPQFVFLAENCGTRPAVDSLITIQAQGNFQIKPPVRDEDDEDDGGDESEDLQEKRRAFLPSPPSIPRGRWQTTVDGREYNQLNTLAKLGQSLARSDSYFQQLDANQSLIHSPHLPYRRDHNEFYYKPDRPRTPQDSFCLECDQWRHEDGGVCFDVEIHIPTDLEEVKGALVCRIQAGNLSKSVSKQIPVWVMSKCVSSFGRAKALVETLVGRQ